MDKVPTIRRADSAIVMLIFIALFVFAIAAAGRFAGNKIGAPGMVSFFGG